MPSDPHSNDGTMRTLFFDLLPIFFRTSALAFRIKVYTVPGQPMHEATRRVVLQGADGVVFVADSAPGQVEANREAWTGMIRNRAELGLAVAQPHQESGMFPARNSA